jgi:uncharacterized phage infection (PIP) family protein YhgE
MYTKYGNYQEIVQRFTDANNDANLSLTNLLLDIAACQAKLNKELQGLSPDLVLQKDQMSEIRKQLSEMLLYLAQICVHLGIELKDLMDFTITEFQSDDV